MPRKRAPEEIIIEFGEKRNGKDSSTRCYFFGETPTGIQNPLNKTPGVNPTGTREVAKDELTATRVLQGFFTHSQPFTCKMVSMHTQFGKGMVNKSLYLNVDPDEQKMEITGPGDFGTITFRGTIDFKRSGMTKEEVKQLYEVSVVAAPIKKKNSNVRSILY